VKCGRIEAALGARWNVTISARPSLAGKKTLSYMGF
jgi:hypothetical protein